MNHRRLPLAVRAPDFGADAHVGGMWIVAAVMMAAMVLGWPVAWGALRRGRARGAGAPPTSRTHELI
jgi:hypothetical protein